MAMHLGALEVMVHERQAEIERALEMRALLREAKARRVALGIDGKPPLKRLAFGVLHVLNLRLRGAHHGLAECETIVGGLPPPDLASVGATPAR